MSEPTPHAGPILDTTTGSLKLDSRTLIRDTSAELASRARRELLLLSRRLDPELYDHRPFLDAVERLALARPNLAVRILVFDPRGASQSGHRLVELTRRLTSRIAIRRVGEDDQDRLDAFLIGDERDSLRRQAADAWEAVADFDNPLAARRLRTDFESLWERSDADPEFRRLLI